MSAAPLALAMRAARDFRGLLQHRLIVLGVLWVVIAGVNARLSPYFLQWNTVTGVLQFSSVIGLLGLGESLVVLGGGGGIDLSVGAMTGFTSILVARHLKTTEDLHDSRPSPRTEALVASAVQWAERILRRIDGTFANSADDKRWPRA